MDDLSNKRILIVDDEEAERALLAAYLKQHHCILYHAENGLDGVNKARAIRPDLILLDAQMPVCNGFDACKVIVSDPETRDIPVIFLSALNWPEQRIRGLLAGAVDYIDKPYDFNEVKLRLAIHLRGRKPVISDSAPSIQAKAPSLDSGADAPSTLQNILFHSARIHLLRSLASPPPMAELEKLTGTNSKHLNRAFKLCAGTTVYEYLREERMKEARVLLQQTSLPIQEIADQTGFSSGANFATAFRERFGVSPRELRRQQDNTNN